ncbi:hypothetical protein HD806DRAFT_524856 [Xylariaceae sp. AK1471]|nr:hypothetical protein HD806DRAFT_524856 [Xylariaceae sp. AK1471]
MRQLKRAVYGELTMGLEANDTVLACRHCVGGWVELPHTDLLAILEDTIGLTGRGAVLIQTYLTSIALLVYHKWQKAFTVSEEATVSSVQSVLVVTNCKEHNGCSGFIAVATILAVYLATVGVITVLYATQTRFSRHGDVWHVVSQLFSPELDDIVKISHSIGDKGLKQTVRGEGNDYMVNLGRSPGSNRVGIMKHTLN